jgi:hypothetical protein
MNIIKIDLNLGCIKRIRDIPIGQPFIARKHAGAEVRLCICWANSVINMEDFTEIAFRNDDGTVYDYQEVDLEIIVTNWRKD